MGPHACDVRVLVVSLTFTRAAATLAGHLVLVLAVVDEEGWRRSGNDLHIDHVISLREVRCCTQGVRTTPSRLTLCCQSLLGFSHEVTHFDGRKVTVRRAGVTPPGM